MQILYAVLEFWFGTWRVCTHDGVEVGRNVVEPAVGGEAVLEHWRGAGGDEGESVFYYERVWQQVWVQPGCVKRKTHDTSWTDGVRFAGTAFLAEGRGVPDRTTLTCLADGRVRQVIEQQRAGVWVASFDALYERTTSS